MDPDPLSACLLVQLCSSAMSDAIVVHAPTVGSIIAIVCASLALLSSAFASASETAFFSITQTQREDIDEDSSRYAQLLALLEQPEKLLATILITNNLVNVTIVILLSYAINQIFVFNDAVVSFILQSVVLTFLILLFGEILPKLYATKHNLDFAVMASGALTALCRLFSPASRVLMKSTYIVDKIVTTHADEISKEDLSQALEITHVHTGDEKELLEGILRFGGTTVTEVMRPRVDIDAVDYSANFNAIVDTVITTGYSRLPVYKDNLDNIVGILYAKDLLPYIGKAADHFNWQSLLREAYFVPETRMIDDLLEDFRKKNIHMAIVVDEFGGTQGIATLEDVLEEIVGDINDEYDTEEVSYQKLPDGSYVFDGKTLLNDFFRVLDLDEKEFEEFTDDVETVAGMLLNIKGDFPKVKESIVYKNIRCLVLSVEKHRIVSVRVKVNQSDEQTA